jgi:hypothetical protein
MMSRSSRKAGGRPLKRKVATRRPRKTLVVFCEGERTEPEYLDALIDEFWCVFDAEWPKNHPGLDEAIRQARTNGINLRHHPLRGRGTAMVRATAIAPYLVASIPGANARGARRTGDLSSEGALGLGPGFNGVRRREGRDSPHARRPPSTDSAIPVT